MICILFLFRDVVFLACPREHPGCFVRFPTPLPTRGSSIHPCPAFVWFLSLNGSYGYHANSSQVNWEQVLPAPSLLLLSRFVLNSFRSDHDTQVGALSALAFLIKDL